MALLLNSLLLFLLSSTSSLLSLADPVLDHNGNPLEADTEYYMISAIHNTGGGVTLANIHGIGQEQSDMKYGIPIKTHPTDDSDAGAIQLLKNNMLEFSKRLIPSCIKSAVWKLSNSMNEELLQVNPQEQGLSLRLTSTKSYFHLQKFSDDLPGFYQLGFCPCSSCKEECRRVGINHKNGRRVLGLNGSQLVVMFVKKGEEAKYIRQYPAP